MKISVVGNKILSLFRGIRRRKKLRIVILIAVAVVGFVVWKFILAPKKNGIQTTEVKKGTVAEELILSGEISADEYAQLTFPTSGDIAWIGVKEGDFVKKGQYLVKLDTTVLNSAFEQARATLRAAEATVANVYDQVQDHSKDETYAQRDTRTTAEVTKDKAYESYVAAEYNLRHSILTSPFAGIVSYLAHPYSGVYVMATETQVEVINPETIYFDVTGDQNEVPSLFIGQKVNIVLDAIPDETFEGIVDFVSYTPKAGEAGAVYEIKVKFAKEKLDIKKFRIGMSGDAKFVIKQKDDVLYVGPEFINSDIKGKYVRLGRQNNKVYIETGIEGEERVEIKDNLKEGDVLYD